MPALRIVTARPDELSRYLDLLESVATWLQSRGIAQWPPGNFRLSAGFYEASMRRGEVHFAFAGEQLVGTFRLPMHDPIVWPEIVEEDGVYIYNLAIARAWSGMGLGPQLLEWCAARGAELGRTAVRLDCMSNNLFLREYYERLGFETRGDVDATFPAPVGTLRLRRYEKRVLPR